MEYTSRVEDKLVYVVLTPTLEESAATFSDGKAYGPMHIWMRCIGSTIKGYFYLEVLSDGDQLVHPPERYKIVSAVRFFANGEPVHTLESTVAGGEFTVDLSKFGSTTTSAVEISFSSWRHFAKFPTSECAPPPPDTDTNAPQLVMNLVTLDRSFSQHYTPPDVAAISNHVRFHSCALNISRFEIVSQYQDVGLFLQDETLLQLAKSKALKFVVKGNSPAQLTGVNYKWQVVEMNVNILSHWGENVRILFWDPDEYLVMHPFSLKEFRRKLVEYDVVNIQRKPVVCETCSTREQERDFHSIGGGGGSKFVQSDKHLATKLAINPNKAGCVLVHFSLCPDSTTNKIRLDSRIAYLAHFENLFRFCALGIRQTLPHGSRSNSITGRHGQWAVGF